MRDEQQTLQQGQLRQKRRKWSGFLWPLLFLLIFLFTRSFAGLLVSPAIIILLEAFIAAAPMSPRGWGAPPMQLTILSPPPQEQEKLPYAQGYRGVPVPSQPQQGSVGTSAQAFPSSQPGMESSEEDDRLAQLKLLGELHHAGTLTDDEFERQKRRILQASETEDEEQPQVEYPQGPW